MTSPKIAGMTIRVSSGDDIMPPRATYLQRVNAHIAWLAEILADGRSYIFGTEPCAADLSADTAKTTPALFQLQFTPR